MRPWLLHPALVHFPIAFLMGALVVEVVARVRRSAALARFGAGMLAAGVVTGLAAAVAGAVAYFTVPAHTEEAHGQMTAHLALAAAALALFAVVAVGRWRRRAQPATGLALGASVLACSLLAAAAALGGKIVYHGGAGIDAEILAPAVVSGHHHHHHHDDGDDGDDDHDHDHEDQPTAAHVDIRP